MGDEFGGGFDDGGGDMGGDSGEFGDGGRDIGGIDDLGGDIPEDILDDSDLFGGTDVNVAPMELQEDSLLGGDLSDDIATNKPPLEFAEDIVEPGAEITHGEFAEAQDALDESILDGTVYNDDIEPGAKMTHGEFLEEQRAFEEEINGEREPEAALSHEEFVEEQNRFEAEVMGVPEDIIDNPDYFDASTGHIKYPSSDSDSDFNDDGSVAGTEHEAHLEVGDELTRRGSLDGSYTGSDDISFEESSLPGREEDYDVHNLEVVEEFPDDIHITEGEIAPGFGHEGGGEQQHFTRDNWLNPDADPLDVPTQDLVDYGYLQEKNPDEVEE
jgi:hypothetical protein